MWLDRTLGAAAQRTPWRSLWYARLETQRGTRPMLDWLTEEANLRGYHGAVVAQLTDRPPTAWLSDEDVVVALLHPMTPVDARTMKLVLRMLQSGRLDLKGLAFLARRESADHALFWLLGIVPEPERDDYIIALQSHLRPPRGYRGLDFDYSPDRLLRKDKEGAQRWKRLRR